MSTRSEERGQILVIFAGGLLALLAIAAVVFDLGMDFMVRRQEQNIADPAALAAAKYIPTVALPLTGGNQATASMVAAACFYANKDGLFPNGYTVSSTGCADSTDPTLSSLTVYYPPIPASSGQYSGRPGFVQTAVTRKRQNFFLGIFGQATTNVSASAVAANTTGDSNSYSLLALDPSNTQGTGTIGGTGGSGSMPKVIIQPATDPSTGLPYTNGGYVQVNSSYPSVPSPTSTVCSSGNGDLTVKGGASITAPVISVTGQCGASGAIATNSGTVNEGVLPVGDPLADLIPPNIATYSTPAVTCGVGGDTATPGFSGCGNGSHQWHGTSCATGVTCVSLQPGVYYGGWSIGNNITLDLAPGIYIMAGGGISLQAGGSITSVTGSSGPAPVLIYSTDSPGATCPGAGNAACQGAIDLSAQSTLALAGMDSGPYKGLLLWQDGHGSCTGSSCGVTIGGQASLTLSGTIYAPAVQVKLDGGSSGTGVAAVQIISWQWMIQGSSELLMPYDPNKLYHLEQRGLVH